MALLNPVRQVLKRILPKNILQKIRPLGHGLESLIFHYYYGRPSDKLIVIGVTGTKGKTSTSHIIYQLINNLIPPLDTREGQEEFVGTSSATKPILASPYIKGRNKNTCGLISTAVIDSGRGEELNQFRMTQMSGAITHKLLKQMLDAGYKYVGLEVSSEGLAQNRHLGINFDIAVFTNLSPDHVEAHGSFENYKRAKGKLFATINDLHLTLNKKEINPQIQKTIISNLDDANGLYFLNFKSEKHITYSIENQSANIVAKSIQTYIQNCRLQIADCRFEIPLPGKFNIYNVLAGIAVSKSLGFGLEQTAEAVKNLHAIPGRMEILQDKPFTVIVDYAHEKASMTALYNTVKEWPHKKIIQVLGATGGVRDKSRRFDLGKLAGEFTDVMIVTDEDPFDEDPQTIIHEIARAAVDATSGFPPNIGGIKGGIKIIDQNLFCIPHRREAIRKALTLAQQDDLVLITGKGAEQKIARANNKYEDWDDRVVVKEELAVASTKY